MIVGLTKNQGDSKRAPVGKLDHPNVVRAMDAGQLDDNLITAAGLQEFINTSPQIDMQFVGDSDELKMVVAENNAP